MKAFIDTWGWLVLGDSKESRHKEIKEWYYAFRKKGGKVFTSDYVLDETYTLLFRRIPFDSAIKALDSIQKSVREKFTIVEWITPARFERAKELRRKYSDKPYISFTDITSMIIMQELDITEVLTDDNHFIQVGLGFNKIPFLK